MEKKIESSPLFALSGHSGVAIPPEANWLRGLEASVLMCDVDAFVDELYGPSLKGLKVPLIDFKWHRYAVDVNRFAWDISSQTVQGADSLYRTDLKIQDSRKGKRGENFNRTRIKGRGEHLSSSPSDIHWLKTTRGDFLIKKALPQELHRELIQKYFEPFHSKIGKQIEKLRRAGHKKIYILDLHSMPSKGKDFHKDPGRTRPQVVISDNEGQSCSAPFRNLILTAYQKAGFETALNWPYKGGAITRHYGRPQSGQNTLQVELNRNLYMDEDTKEKTADYKKTQSRLKQALSYIVSHL